MRVLLSYEMGERAMIPLGRQRNNDDDDDDNDAWTAFAM